MRFRFSSDQGSALVETALTLPVVLFMLLGAVEFARVACAGIEITNAAKAAAAYGAQNRGTVGDTPGIQLAATNEVDGISGLTFDSSTVQPLISGMCSSGATCTGKDYGSGPTCLNTDCTDTGDHAETILTVSVSGTIDPLIHVPGLPSSYVVYGNAKQVVLQP